MLASLRVLGYRLLCLVGYAYVAYVTVKLHPQKPSLKENIIQNIKFLTSDTLFLHVLYYGVSILLMPSRYHRLKSTLSSLALTTAGTVSLLFWSIYLYDASLLADPEILNLPSWYIHATHSVITLTAFFDILLARPNPVPFVTSLLYVLAYYLGYLLLTEYLIWQFGIYPYPLLKRFLGIDRIQFYGIVLVVIFVIFLISVLVIKMVSSERKRKSKKDKTRNKKPQQPQQQQPQKQPQAPVTNAKKKKQNKHE